MGVWGKGRIHPDGSGRDTWALGTVTEVRSAETGVKSSRNKCYKAGRGHQTSQDFYKQVRERSEVNCTNGDNVPEKDLLGNIRFLGALGSESRPIRPFLTPPSPLAETKPGQRRPRRLPRGRRGDLGRPPPAPLSSERSQAAEGR